MNESFTTNKINMRELKMQFWYEEQKVMSPWMTLLEFANDISQTHIFENSVQEKLEYDAVRQYTWIKDKNWLEIYEGDYIKIYDENGLFNWEWVVKLRDCAFHVFDDYTILRDMSSGGYGEAEIMGNIYENPKLLLTN